MTLRFIAPTKRRKMTKARAARLFLDNNGICCNCGQQIRQGETWFIEHQESLALGGADDDLNGKPAHIKCKAAKDAQDAAAKAKRDRIVTAGLARPTSKLRGPGFQKAEPQRTASKPLTKAVGVFEEIAKND